MPGFCFTNEDCAGRAPNSPIAAMGSLRWRARSPLGTIASDSVVSSNSFSTRIPLPGPKWASVTPQRLLTPLFKFTGMPRLSAIWWGGSGSPAGVSIRRANTGVISGRLLEPPVYVVCTTKALPSSILLVLLGVALSAISKRSSSEKEFAAAVLDIVVSVMTMEAVLVGDVVGDEVRADVVGEAVGAAVVGGVGVGVAVGVKVWPVPQSIPFRVISG